MLRSASHSPIAFTPRSLCQYRSNDSIYLSLLLSVQCLSCPVRIVVISGITAIVVTMMTVPEMTRKGKWMKDCNRRLAQNLWQQPALRRLNTQKRLFASKCVVKAKHLIATDLEGLSHEIPIITEETLRDQNMEEPTIEGLAVGRLPVIMMEGNDFMNESRRSGLEEMIWQKNRLNGTSISRPNICHWVHIMTKLNGWNSSDG